MQLTTKYCRTQFWRFRSFCQSFQLYHPGLHQSMVACALDACSQCQSAAFPDLPFARRPAAAASLTMLDVEPVIPVRFWYLLRDPVAAGGNGITSLFGSQPRFCICRIAQHQRNGIHWLHLGVNKLVIHACHDGRAVFMLHLRSIHGNLNNSNSLPPGLNHRKAFRFSYT